MVVDLRHSISLGQVLVATIMGIAIVISTWKIRAWLEILKERLDKIERHLNGDNDEV